MIKYMYQWMAWGLFDVKEVEVLQSDDENCLVRFKKGLKPFIYPKKYLFDTYEEAYAFGKEDCPGGAF